MGITGLASARAESLFVLLACVRAGQRICSLAEVSEFEREVERLNKLRDAVFLRGCIPWWNAAAGYAAFSVLAIVVIPLLYHPVKWCAPPALPVGSHFLLGGTTEGGAVEQTPR